ncbi:siderophore-iron reductase FhuF [Castellaniella ginsengisoli]|jgi:ferric iron reductase protein FhuF|uniref:Siderophore-iron reductase FhuF n=1 Tax=Castellaniella ginsengisoli TaxID=546114 RepID=A0AB39F279_9BURK
MQTDELIHKLRQDGALAPLLSFLPSGLRDDGRWLPACELLRPDTLAALLGDFATAEGHPGGDGRAIASLWSRWHFWAVLPPLVAALLLHRCAPGLRAVRLSPMHRTCELAWEAQVPVFAPESARAACELVVWQARPLIEVLADLSGASPRVFWSNLGNLLEYLVTQLRPHPGVCGQMLRAFDVLLESPVLADGGLNPVERPVRYEPGPVPGLDGVSRVRKVCCLYYLLPGTELCENCPCPARVRCHVHT